MKLLVITSNPRNGEAFATLATQIGFDEGVVASHDEALAQFLTEEPTHVLICEYEADGEHTRSFTAGKQTWKDLTASALPTQRLVRCGFMACTEPDFLRLPFGPEELQKALGV